MPSWQWRGWQYSSGLGRRPAWNDRAPGAPGPRFRTAAIQTGAGPAPPSPPGAPTWSYVMGGSTRAGMSSGKKGFSSGLVKRRMRPCTCSGGPGGYGGGGQCQSGRRRGGVAPNCRHATYREPTTSHQLPPQHPPARSRAAGTRAASSGGRQGGSQAPGWRRAGTPHRFAQTGRVR